MPSDSVKSTKRRPLLFMRYLAAFLLVVSATALGELLHPFTSLPNLVMLYLLAVSVLCVDKTGTITMNKMAVQDTWAINDDNYNLCEIMGLGCETDAYDPMERQCF